MARAAARKAYPLMTSFGEPGKEAWGKYMLGEIDEEKMFDACDHRFDLAYAYFWSAINALANNERNQAVYYFEQVRETNVFQTFAFWWSTVFLERMAEDENWLPWLASEK